MARKGNQQKNGLDRNASHHKFTVSDSVGGPLPEKKHKAKAHEGKTVDGEELPNANHQCRSSSPLGDRAKAKFSGDRKKNNQKSAKASTKDQLGDDIPGSVKLASMSSNSRDAVGNETASDATELRGDDGVPLESNPSSINFSTGHTQHGLADEDVMDGSGSSGAVAGMNLKASALSILKTASIWLERQKPLFDALTTILSNACDYVRLKTEHAYPIIWRWLSHFGKLVLLLSMVWLDCSLRGLDSLLRLGTTSFFTVIWCSILSVIAMVGTSKFLIMMVTAGLLALFVGFTIAILVAAVFATVFLWLYGSFWTTGFVIFAGGISFALSHERLALLITTIYSLHSAKCYVGWLGVLLGINLSFISSDVLIHFLKNNISEHNRSNSRPEQSTRSGFFHGEPMHASQSDDATRATSGRSADHNPGVPSTSGAEAELTSEDEVIRLLNCNDHYSALGLSRYENIDVSLLKREYRKKAMLVHPDKNMGNEKAAEAFKKLQNAYEVLLDSLKRKAYDDELRREELLNYFRKFQSASSKNGRHGPFASGFPRSEADDEDPHGDSRRIACKKCGNFHVWAHTDRSKSRARWCQECKDFHPAKDGDGWVEQSFQPFLFGLLQKVDAPCAYVCAESRIYDATEWFICQGMRCPANTHKPSFHVNTSITSKHSNTKGTGSAHRSGGMPTTNMDESMTEEEFFEWLQNAVQSGLFETSSPSTENPSARAGSSSKSGSAGKKKKKGKKQW
ncbi:uncharacterized protein LOC131224645 [Magnolia sinica]|uniref:uncharacterized protein LOC131224645 n=1 Tax=Magnolia sinica TaxID=86752 RepID=UPI0026581724|nr:uncharacterized protein LOC131224645 [Magnolia sinica]